MDIIKEISDLTSIINNIDDTIEKVKELEPCENVLICKLRLKEASMWLKGRYKELNNFIND